jgi:transaldolase
MEFFLDTADLNELRTGVEWGMVDGATTNPSLVAKQGKRYLDAVKEVAELVPGPVSGEVLATDYKTILEQAHKLAALAKNVVVKVPLTPDGLRACRTLRGEGTKVNVTLCFSAAQALLAAKAGATYISPFVGRLDDVSADGMGLIRDIVSIYRQYPDFRTEVLVASIRHPMHVVEAGKIGAQVCTMPPNVLRQMFQHPLTDKGLAAFLADWRKTGQSILG